MSRTGTRGSSSACVNSRCRTGETGCLCRQGRAPRSTATGGQNWRRVQPESPGRVVPMDLEREAQLPQALRSVPQPHRAGPVLRGESHTLQGHSLGPHSALKGSFTALKLQTTVKSDNYQASVYYTDFLKRHLRRDLQPQCTYLNVCCPDSTF